MFLTPLACLRAAGGCTGPKVGVDTVMHGVFMRYPDRFQIWLCSPREFDTKANEDSTKTPTIASAMVELVR